MNRMQDYPPKEHGLPAIRQSGGWWLLLLSLLLAGNRVWAVDLYLPPQITLPEEIYTFPGGSVTKRQLLAEALRASQPAPGDVPLLLQAQPTGFVEFILLDMLAREKMLTGVDEETSKRLAQLIARAGGNERFDENLRRYSRPLRTRADFYRQLRHQVLAELTGYVRLTPAEIEKRFHPRWYGPSGGITASVAGSDFTGADLAQFLLLEAGDEELANLLQELIARQILLAEAGKMGFNTEGFSATQALEAMFAPLVTTEALREYYQSRIAEYPAYKVREFLVTGGLQAGQSPESASGKTTVEEVHKRAKVLAEQLRSGTDVTSLLSTGRLAYYYRMNVPPSLVPPTVYGLDYNYDASSAVPENPFRPAPDFLKEPLKSAQSGKLLGVFDLPPEQSVGAQAAGGRSLVLFCVDVLPAKVPERLIPALRMLRLTEQRERLLGALTAPGTGRQLWRPTDRLTQAQLYPQLPALAPVRENSGEGNLLLPEYEQSRSGAAPLPEKQTGGQAPPAASQPGAVPQTEDLTMPELPR